MVAAFRGSVTVATSHRRQAYAVLLADNPVLLGKIGEHVGPYISRIAAT
jgi:hypothetical protein